MKINRDNYEAYFLDYHEGQLSPEMAKEVMLFVELNPDLKNILNEFEAVTLAAEHNIVFENKSSLKKNQVSASSQVDELNYEEYLIGETEGLLNIEQIASLEKFIHINPQFEKDRRLYALTHLPFENDIFFEAKETLKKKAIPVGLINADTYEAFMARELEGDLNQDEKLEFAEFMQYNPHLERDRKLYTHTILSAETDVVFENKSNLKKYVIPVRRLVYYALSAAAMLALIFSVYFLLDRNNIPGEIAYQGNVKTDINNVVPMPADVIPDAKADANHSKPVDVASAPVQATYYRTNVTIHNVAVTYPVQEAIASADLRIVKPMQPRSAREVTTRSFVDPQFTFIRTSQMYMNQNLEFYYNVKLAEEIQYAQVNSQDKDPAKTILNAAAEKVGDFFAFNRKKTTPSEDKKNLSLWTFAELGVRTFNTVTSSELELNLRKDEKGNVIGYNLESGIIDYEKELKK